MSKYASMTDKQLLMAYNRADAMHSLLKQQVMELMEQGASLEVEMSAMADEARRRQAEPQCAEEAPKEYTLQ
jgi:hypothetical protein